MSERGVVEQREMTVKDLRAALEGVPDDTPVIVLYDSYFGSVWCDLIDYEPAVGERHQQRFGITSAFYIGGA